MITERYRDQYIGEFVIGSTTVKNGVKSQNKEWIPNSISNQHISGRAAVILSGSDKEQFNYKRLAGHKGGIRGTKRLQTYGTDDVWADLQLNFYVSTNGTKLNSIITTDYANDTVVYSDRKRVLAFPGKLFLVPHCPPISDPALALYLASFDQHREIFVLGHAGPDANYRKSWRTDVQCLMQIYDKTQFYFIGAESGMPSIWRQCRNFAALGVRDFVSLCDI